MFGGTYWMIKLFFSFLDFLIYIFDTAALTPWLYAGCTRQMMQLTHASSSWYCICYLEALPTIQGVFQIFFFSQTVLHHPCVLHVNLQTWRLGTCTDPCFFLQTKLHVRVRNKALFVFCCFLHLPKLGVKSSNHLDLRLKLYHLAALSAKNDLELQQHYLQLAPWAEGRWQVFTAGVSFGIYTWMSMVLSNWVFTPI